MRAPKKVIAAMAVATMIGGTVAPAFADDFKETTGPINGKPAKNAFLKVTDDGKKDVQGDIAINGEFTKSVSNLPDDLDKTQDGKYLCITMPLSLNYTYDVSKDIMVSGDAVIKNDSVSVKGNAANPEDAVVTEQPVNMSFVKIADLNNNMKYVTDTTKDVSNKSIVELPFQLDITTNGKSMKSIALADLADLDNPVIRESVKDIKITAGNNVKFGISQISGQKVKNGNLLKEGTKVSNNLTLKFEYAGN